MLSAAALHVVLVRFSRTEGILRDFVQLGDSQVVGTEEQEPLACVRSAVSGILYAADAAIVSSSAEGLAETMNVIVTVFEAAGLKVSEKKTEIMLLRTPCRKTLPLPLVIEAAGQRY